MRMKRGRVGWRGLTSRGAASCRLSFLPRGTRGPAVNRQHRLGTPVTESHLLAHDQADEVLRQRVNVTTELAGVLIRILLNSRAAPYRRRPT